MLLISFHLIKIIKRIEIKKIENPFRTLNISMKAYLTRNVANACQKAL